MKVKVNATWSPWLLVPLKINLNVEFERSNTSGLPEQNTLTLKREMLKLRSEIMVAMNGAQQDLSFCEVWRVNINRIQTMVLNTYLHLTLKLEMLIVKFNENG